jgi:DNA (cytosine-5)-methyltransferase 1
MTENTNVPKVAELFCGIGGFRLASDNLDLRTVFANDLDVTACNVYKHNFGSDGLFVGDINNFKDKVPDHDILTAGFPCQPFSSAGKKKGIEDIRGTLFESIADILFQKKPKMFVLENVKRLLSMQNGLHFSTILRTLNNAGYSVEWCLLNAVKFGLPQHRERVVLVGYRNNTTNLCFLPNLVQRFHNGDGFYVPSKWSPLGDKNKFHSWGLALNGNFISASLGHPMTSHVNVCLKDILQKSVDDKFYFNEDTEERIKGSVKVDRYFNGVEILYNQKGGARMGYSIFGTNGVSSTLTSSTSRHYERYSVADGFRRLTPTEYARIQGFPDNHCSTASQRLEYVLYGNAVPPAMVEWALAKAMAPEKVCDISLLTSRQKEIF